VVYQQLPLNLRLRADATFSNFVAHGNEAIMHTLCQTEEPYVYLWGENASGKTHLLQALCQQDWLEGKTAVYIPLMDEGITEPDIFLGLEEMDLVCIDDLHVIAGQAEWESMLFNLFNAIQERAGRLVVSARATPNAIDIQLADLRSRLNWGVMYQINGLQDSDKIDALQTRAAQLGMNLSLEVADYLLKHSPRDMASLFALLRKLDTASLAEKRRLTIPFIRQHL